MRLRFTPRRSALRSHNRILWCYRRITGIEPFYTGPIIGKASGRMVAVASRNAARKISRNSVKRRIGPSGLLPAEYPHFGSAAAVRYTPRKSHDRVPSFDFDFAGCPRSTRCHHDEAEPPEPVVSMGPPSTIRVRLDVRWCVDTRLRSRVRSLLADLASSMTIGCQVGTVSVPGCYDTVGSVGHPDGCDVSKHAVAGEH